MTLSLLERSNATPIGDVSSRLSVIGSLACLASSVSVATKTLVISSGGTLLLRGVFDLVTRLMSEDAVETTTTASVRSGG